MSRLVLSGLLLALVGCASSAEGEGGEAAPVIDRLEPSSAPAGEAYPVRLRVVGGPFDAEGNTVRFGPLTIADLRSPDGTTLELQLPKSMPSASEVPPMVLRPGEYDVVVETSRGSSEPAVFVLTAG